MSDAHRLLRERTRDLHEDTEAAFAAFDLDDRTSYGGFLIAQAKAVIPIEGWLDQRVPAELPDWPQRRRGALLLADIAELGLDPPADTFAPRSLDGDPLGVVYVLEGARLGARLLARRVLASRDPLIAACTRFLAERPDPARWRTLTALLDASPLSRHAALLDGARSAFRLFGQAARSAPQDAAAAAALNEAPC